MERVARLAAQQAVVIFSSSTCCMCHAIKSLFQDLGVNYTVHELDEEPYGADIVTALSRLIGRSSPLPAVFVGGKLVGSTDRVMALHLAGKLAPLLSDAGAKWL
ncbi:unnamed protein product [Spirodela intermedia]|uniref:Glutaredoxin domain-containing protein n=1 Tax=Spirodela intermedia TaxID=51605 RepID=A0A7I8KQ57_SPIIN|nr:unnamed protein product [Spirodela intermedia]